MELHSLLKYHPNVLVYVRQFVGKVHVQKKKVHINHH